MKSEPCVRTSTIEYRLVLAHKNDSYPLSKFAQSSASRIYVVPCFMISKRSLETRYEKHGRANQKSKPHVAHDVGHVGNKSTALAEPPSADTQETMDPQAFQRLHPRAYLERFLAEGIRLDEREPSSWRKVSVNAGTYVQSLVSRISGSLAIL